MKKSLLFIVIVMLIVSCKRSDCDYTNCINGNCLDGTCNCYPGFTGTSCDVQITPSLIKITKIDLVTFPSGFFDEEAEPNPDLYICVLSQDSIIYRAPTCFTDAVHEQTYSFIPEPPINITNPKGKYEIFLYDYDTADEDDLWGFLDFTPYSDHNQFPKSEILGTGGLEFKVYYTYEW